ncbi:MAG: type IX secretion system outer membrane channel protein PorV [Bacteroidia bacterium]|nr:type IX secretion system outer membrane channel protein PorV [Bacteroidia bacterium]
MKKTISASLIAVILISSLSVFNDINAQTSPDNLLGQLNTITTAVPFLSISPDARAGGMGDVGVATMPTSSAMHWNISKLAWSEDDMGVSISYTPWLRSLVPDINLAYLSWHKKIQRDQAISASLRYFSLGAIQLTDINGNPIGESNPNEFAIDVGYARILGDEFSGGLSLRYINSNLTNGQSFQGIETKAGQSVAADLSALWRHDVDISGKDGKVQVGANISNIGSKITYTNLGNAKDFIPINLRLGGALIMDLNEYNELTVALDFNKLLVPSPPVYCDTCGTGVSQILFGENPDKSVAEGIFSSFSDAPNGFEEEVQEINIAFGMEYWYDKQFAFRLGYFNEHENKGNRKYLTLGAGLKFNVFGLDFAYLIPTEQRHPLENTLRFTLHFDIAGLQEQNEEILE